MFKLTQFDKITKDTAKSNLIVFYGIGKANIVLNKARKNGNYQPFLPNYTFKPTDF